jgi:archaellum component FlaC
MAIHRSPKSESSDTSKSGTESVPKTSTEANRVNKRPALEMDIEEDNANIVEPTPTLSDIMNELRRNEVARKIESLGIREDIAVLRNEVTEQISEVKTSLEEMSSKVNGLTIKVNGIDNKVKDLETSVNDIAETANENKKLIGALRQDKLEKFMEIDGIKDNVFNATNDYKQLALEIITSFGISINPSEIEHAFKKEINLKRKVNDSDKKMILTVIFANINSKIRVLKAKRALTDKSTIYFNAALTYDNRNLIHKTKTIVEGKLKVYFSRGCVRVQKKDKSEILVDEESKLAQVQNYYAQIKQQQQQQHQQQQ